MKQKDRDHLNRMLGSLDELQDKLYSTGKAKKGHLASVVHQFKALIDILLKEDK